MAQQRAVLRNVCLPNFIVVDIVSIIGKNKNYIILLNITSASFLRSMVSTIDGRDYSICSFFLTEIFF
jgi:hypothetical protein